MQLRNNVITETDTHTKKNPYKQTTYDEFNNLKNKTKKLDFLLSTFKLGYEETMI